MTYTERPEVRRLLGIAAYLEAHRELDAPTIGAASCGWDCTARPDREAAVLAVVDNWKLVETYPTWVLVAGFHPLLGAVTAQLDRTRGEVPERDWAALGIAEAKAVAS